MRFAVQTFITMGAKKCYMTINSNGQERHNDLDDGKETEYSVTTLGNVVIYREISGRIEYREKCVFG